MTFHRTLGVRSEWREQLIDITSVVSREVAASGVRDGVATLFVPHTTSAVTVNENWDPAVQADILHWLAKLVPEDAGFQHSEGNSDAHLKASLVGPSLQVPVIGGKLLLGQWQGVYFCEFDGPRERHFELVVQ